MMNRQINLTWLRSFEAAARHLSFTDASQELGLTQTAVSLHIRSLEDRLGSALFHRNARHLTLTGLGQAYVTTVRQALADINLATASLFGPSGTRAITIKAPVSTAALWLAPQLPAFRAAHPGIDLRLVTNIWTEMTGAEDVDVELRLGRGDWTDAPSEKLSEEQIVPICRVADRPSIRRPGDLLNRPLIHILGYEGYWLRIFSDSGITPPQARSGLVCDTTISAIELVAAGGGVAAVLERLLASSDKDGRSVVRAGPSVASPDAHYLMRPRSKRAVRPEVTLFENWLQEKFLEHLPAG